MRMPRLGFFLLACGGLLLSARLHAGAPTPDFQPDAKSVQRHGPAYRYPQAGWIVLHIEGAPHERGEQHGRLLAPEIVDYVRACATEYGSKSPEQAWRLIRTMVNALFVRQFEQEYLEEMKGIADGAAAAGAKFDGRPIDLVDIVALNCWPEIETLDDAVEALPTGLEGMRFQRSQPKRMPAPAEGHCSAFAATGPATADGKIVFGHITMWNLRLAPFFNVWLDVQPAKGNRVLMQSFPGGIQSGTDYYMNSAGLLVTETTIRQTRFDVKGQALAGRIRKALQYTDSIDSAVDILKSANNGLYSNEWLLGDTKTSEIAMFELGTHHSHLYRSSKGDWFGGTEGFYWGCNNTKDMQVRLETIPGVGDRPHNMVWRPTDRDRVWLRLYAENKGKITADFGRLAFTTPPLCAIHSLDAKYTTSAMAKRLESFAVFGPPMGTKWEPTKEDKERDANVRPLVGNSWTVLRPDRPAAGSVAVAVVDLRDKVRAEADEDDKDPPTAPAWHGTILAKSDADIWLAAAFGEYERLVATETALKKRSDGKLTAAGEDRLAVALNAYRASYLAAVRRAGDTPLSQIKQGP
ncbi:MAG TPA: C45 family peptidase, partial [Gemmataceae bacterium]|nr:C45 family peptidase [Gemmataceae bacterium]